MYKSYYYSLFLSSMIGLFACSADDDNYRQNEYSQLWHAKVEAEKEGGDVVTRAMFFGGNSGTRYYMLWDVGDKADVYHGDTKVGTFTPSSYGYSNSIMNGSLTGTFAVGDAMKAYLPSADVDYTGQKGTVGDMSSNHTFMEASSTISEVDVEGHYVDMNKLGFKHRQFFLSFQFMDEDGSRLHIEQLTISAAGGRLLLTKTKEGVTTYGDLVINPEKVNGEYPSEVYVAIHNDLGTTDTYSFTVKSNGYYYASTNAASKVTANISDGIYGWVHRTLSLQSAAVRITPASSVNNFTAGNGSEGESGSIDF